jgi:hypothetical protein
MLDKICNEVKPHSMGRSYYENVKAPQDCGYCMPARQWTRRDLRSIFWHALKFSPIIRPSIFEPFFAVLNNYLVGYKPSNYYQNSTQYVIFQLSKPITTRENRFSLLGNKNFHFGGPYRLWMVNFITHSQNFSFQSTFNCLNRSS